jgi:uncharacterized protein YbbC (DUF1343 family)
MWTNKQDYFMKRTILLIYLLAFFFVNNILSNNLNNNMNEKIKVKVGAELFVEKYLDLIKGKNIGIITNHSALLPDGRHIVDVLYSLPDVKIKALFGPEHGIRGDAPDGLKIDHDVDPTTKIKIFSLYGKITKPTKEMLDGIDVLIFDIQDVGVRFYTFTSTLFLTLEAAAENKIQYIVLDRPNPINGLNFDGPVIDDSLKSFVGLHSIPISHGMTVGELAKMVNNEGWLKNGVKADLRVIEMEGWERKLWYDETSLQWIKPSPNMMSMNTAVIYPGLCFIEGTNISEGRGTMYPFEYIGAPFINGDKLANELNGFKLGGVEFHSVTFTPQDISLVTTDPKYEGLECHGVCIDVKNRNIYEPVKTGIYILYALKKVSPDDFKWRSPARSTGKYYIDLLAGTPKIRELLNQGKNPDEIISLWQEGLDKFKNTRKKYLIYN